jgi:hypothetical protein
MNRLIKHIPEIDASEVLDRKKVYAEVKESYNRTQEKIIKDRSIHPLIRYLFEYCPSKDGIDLLMILIFIDVNGVISKQLATKTNRRL